MTTYKRGDVILVRFPNSDLVTYKKRPALVVQDENIDTGLNQWLVAMITSNLCVWEKHECWFGKILPQGRPWDSSSIL